MKLWQYGTIIVLIICAWYAGDVGGYNAGHIDGYDLGYSGGVFDEGWHAADTLNITYTDSWGGTYYKEDGVWYTTIPQADSTPITLSFNGVYWQPED